MALTGLRFLPLFAIVWHHARDRFTFMNGFAEFISYHHGVAFFFILSGFILTYNYTYVKDVGTSLHFLLARLARLWPTHVFCLAMLLFLIPEVFSVKGQLVPVFFCNLFMFHAWIPLPNYYFSFNGPSWSSSTLAFFDLAFPFLFLTAKKSWTKVLAFTAGLVVLMISLCNIFHMELVSAAGPCIKGMVCMNPLARLLEFTTGMIACLAYQKYAHRFKLGAIGTTAVELTIIGLIAFITCNSHQWNTAMRPVITEAAALWIHNSGDIFIPIALLLVVFATERGWVSKLFGTKWMGVLGDLSFALYMIHGVFIAYFTVNFHNENSPVAAVCFFSSMLIAAHLMDNFIIQPLRDRVLRGGTRVLEMKWPSPKPPKNKKPRDKAKVFRGRMILAAEVLIFALLVYNALPTIDRITPQQAASAAKSAKINNIVFAPSIKCNSASAHLVNQNGRAVVAVNTVWQALEPQSVDYFMGVQVLDSKGAMIGFSNYKMDGRLQRVDRGQLWMDSVDVSVSSADVGNVLIKLTKGKKRKLVTPEENPAVSPTRDSIVVPVVASSGNSI